MPPGCFAGSVLSDVTEAVGLIADEQTLTAGCIAEHLAAQARSLTIMRAMRGGITVHARVRHSLQAHASLQVTPSSVRLCPLDALLGAEQPKGGSLPGASPCAHRFWARPQPLHRWSSCMRRRPCEGQKGSRMQTHVGRPRKRSSMGTSSSEGPASSGDSQSLGGVDSRGASLPDLALPDEDALLSQLEASSLVRRPLAPACALSSCMCPPHGLPGLLP